MKRKMEQTKNLDRFMGKAKEVEIEGQKFVIKALTVRDIKLISDLENPEKRADSMQKILAKILRDSIPDITDEQTNNFSLAYLEPLMNAFAEVNNIGENLPESIKKRFESRKK